MNEVSCKVLDPFLRAADRRGIARDDLVRGVRYSRKHLESKNERIDYEAFEQIMLNVRTWFDDDDIVAIGAEGISSPLVRSFLTIGRTIMTPVGFYRWMLSAGGLGNQMFSNVVPVFRETEPGHFVVELRTSAGYRPNREFLLMSRGGMEAVSRVLGLGKEARVEMSWTESGARYDIRVPAERSIRGGLIKLLSLPLRARNAAADLEDALRDLEARYADLETARSAVERQRALLDTAYQVGHRIWGEREPSAIGDVVARSMVEIAGFVGARVTAAAAGDASPLIASHGNVVTGAPLEVDLTGRRLTGTLQVWTSATTDPLEARTLLDLLAATAALAIDNAFAYRELAAYQQGLERLVVERTAELRTAHDELAGTVEQLREAQGARERIFANISHEIRTPLTMILLAVADVEARAGLHLDDDARGGLSSVVDSARKLLRLVDELLLLAAGQETELRVAVQPTDLGKLLAMLVTTWRPAIAASGLTLDAHVPDRLAVVLDPVAIERVLTNLLSNAVKFTPRGGRISLDVVRDGELIRISVRDTGVGIDDELAQRLFGRFERGRSGSMRAGSGIGLSLVKELVEAHGGTVTVARPTGGGTELRVVLPAIDAASATAPSAVPQLRPSDYGLVAAEVRSGDVISPPVASGITVLVAEDDPRLASMIGRLLGDEYNVVVALDGLAALALVRQHQPHLLVTDVDMPGMDGIELTRRFRESTGDTLAPVVILSALSDPGHRLAGLGAGAVDYVVKPFEPGELRARVRSQLSMRDLALRLHRAEQLSALGTLSSGLAHELRNPANGIVNAIGPLKRLLPADLVDQDHPVGQLLDVLGGCADQIAFLSRQLLSFRRGGELELRMVAIADVVQRAVTLASPALRGLTLRESIEVVDPVRCAPPLLIQVLTNLLENAAHAAGAGGWVAISAAASDGHVTLEVADSGPGVALELRDRVFEPFFTTKPPGVGTGLGLPLARDIIHRHGGVLEIRERDQRSVFVVELPHDGAGWLAAESGDFGDRRDSRPRPQ